MHKDSKTTYNTVQRVRELIRVLGPGIMTATAAVGGSHLVASTKAGAIYGWQLVGLILLVNLFKYPFFRAGVQYTMATRKTLIQGYGEMGRGYLWLFSILNAISGVINTAALLLFSASLLGYFLPIQVPLTTLAVVVLLLCLVILFLGHYKALDRLSKIIMVVLVFTTISAVVIAALRGGTTPASFQSPSPWTIASIGFLVAMMGWMPAPIEISCFTSVWLKQQCKETQVTKQSALFDFNLGYIGTAVLAIVFLSLGALVVHGTGVELKSSGIGFSHQLVSMYASAIGQWSRYLIAIVAFLCIFGTTITVIDGYPRTLVQAGLLLKNKQLEDRRYYHDGVVMTIVGVLAITILFFFRASLMGMLNFAMILAFITTPFFALLNYRLITKTDLPEGLTLSKPLKGLSLLGLVYLFGFLAVFIWWKWIL